MRITKRKRTVCVFVIFILAFFSITTSAAAWGGLKGKIQKELEQNPFLKNERIKLKVVDEQNGYVTIEMVEGPRALRADIHEGMDIYSDSYLASITGKKMLMGGSYSFSALKALKRSLNYIRKMDGVKEILLTAAVNTPMDRADDFYIEGRRLDKQKQYREAATKYRKAAEQGHARGQTRLGISYTFGHGVRQDYKEAAKWFRKAAEQGHAHGQTRLGMSYAFGHGVRQDNKEAAKWFRKAAEQGHAYGQTCLGISYAFGHGVRQDNKEAAKWFRKAAEQGHASGQTNLGISYVEGRGVRQDYKEAAKWFRKAATQDDVSAMNALALLFATCNDSRVRHGKNAVSWAKRAIREEPDKWRYVSTLAAAYARNNQFNKAVEAARKSIDLLEKEKWDDKSAKKKELSEGRERLELYKNRKPYTETKTGE